MEIDGKKGKYLEEDGLFLIAKRNLPLPIIPKYVILDSHKYTFDREIVADAGTIGWAYTSDDNENRLQITIVEQSNETSAD